MVQLIALGIVAISAIWAFFSPSWAWLPMLLFGGYLLFILAGVRGRTWRRVDALSSAANELLQKFGHYYAMPAAGTDFSSSASTLQVGAIPVTVIGLFKGFYWAALWGIFFFLVFGAVAVRFNPSNFIQGTTMETAHLEIIRWIQDQHRARSRQLK